MPGLGYNWKHTFEREKDHSSIFFYVYLGSLCLSPRSLTCTLPTACSKVHATYDSVSQCSEWMLMFQGMDCELCACKQRQRTVHFFFWACMSSSEGGLKSECKAGNIWPAFVFVSSPEKQHPGDFQAKETIKRNLSAERLGWARRSSFFLRFLRFLQSLQSVHRCQSPNRAYLKMNSILTFSHLSQSSFAFSSF